MRAVLASIVFLAACSSTTTFSSSGGAVAPRPPGATYPNWEHFCTGVSQGFGAEDRVNELLASAGREGWELVTYSEALFCFKRPIAVAAAPAVAPPAPVAPVAPVQ
jgi:hypothetical protein